jgi:YceI-like domain
MKKLILALIAIFTLTSGYSQKILTKEGKVYFDATSSLEKIEATNNKANAVFDLSNGKVAIAILVKSFHFEKALMEEHFNENYLESTKFPKSTFEGSITDFKNVNLKKDGTYPVNISGKLSMHGVTKDVTSKGTITIKGKDINAKTEFQIQVGDYKIAIPGLVKEKIAKSAKILVDLKMKL